MQALSINFSTVTEHEQHLLALAGRLSESAGYGNLEIMVSLLKHDRKAWLQAVVKDKEIVAAIGFKSGPFPGLLDHSWITPLMSTGRPSYALEAASDAFKVLAESTKKPSLLLEIPCRSHAFSSLLDAFPHHQVLRQWQRACLNTDGNYEGWLSDNFDHKRRKELKRLRARLSEQGELKVERLADFPLDGFIDDFLRLEAGGWKGQKGSALQQDAALTAALRDGLARMQVSGKLRFWRITLDGKAIAALFAIVECGTATLGKIAYDEGFAKYSPGVLVILDATADFFADPAVRVADSNAVPDHPMINRIWRERLELADIAVAGGQVSAARFTLAVRVERLRASLRSMVKRLYYRLQRK